ncbi:MAG TPA: transcriptional regulator [Anaerolineales bacterium]|nr:transcriptional regulator [Anaerolineales bacterium]
MTTLIWDFATGYDLFISLHVLHQPDMFALRGSWAKGVRTRLPAGAREFFEEISPHLLAALPWVHGLDGPRDGETVLDALAEIPPEQRFTALMKTPEVPDETVRVLDEIAERERWTEKDLRRIREASHGYKSSDDELKKMLALWARSADLGRRTLDALFAYYQAFFAEEEARIRPALDAAVERGTAMAAELTFPDLLAELSEGIRFEEAEIDFPEMVMVPSFWITPRILLSRLGPGRGLFVHGGRPAEASIVPGEAVPDALYLALKALADPTRLRILHYLEEEPQTPSELARTLRLRAPTVIHHLNSLRLAGLVYVTFGHGDKRYAARTSRVAEMYLQLRRYLGAEELGARDEPSGRPPYTA